MAEEEYFTGLFTESPRRMTGLINTTPMPKSLTLPKKKSMPTGESPLVTEELSKMKQEQEMDVVAKKSPLYPLAFPYGQSSEEQAAVQRESNSSFERKLQVKDERLQELTSRCDELQRIEELCRNLQSDVTLKNEQVEALEKTHVCLQQQAHDSERKHMEELMSLMNALERSTNDTCAREQLIEILARDLKKVKVTLERCKDELLSRDKKVKDLEEELKTMKISLEKAEARGPDVQGVEVLGPQASNGNSDAFDQQPARGNCPETCPESCQNERRELQTQLTKLKKKGEVWNLEKATLVSALQAAENQIYHRHEQLKALQEEVRKMKKNPKLANNDAPHPQPQPPPPTPRAAELPRYCALCSTKVLGKENPRSTNNRMIISLEQQLREQWQTHRVLQDRLKSMKRQLNLRLKELRTAERDRDAVEAKLVSVQERACTSKCDMDWRLSVLQESLVASSAQLQEVTWRLRESCQQQVSLQTDLAQRESNLVTMREGNVDGLLEKVALEDSAKALQRKSMKLLQRLTATRLRWGQNCCSQAITAADSVVPELPTY